MYTEQDQSPCNEADCLLAPPSFSGGCVAMVQCSCLSHRAGNSQDMSRHAQISFVYVAARGQGTCSLLASPPCSTVCVTPFMLTLHSTDHYITIGHPVTLTTTTTSCLSGNLTYGPAHLAQIGGGGVPQKIHIFYMTHLALVQLPLYTTCRHRLNASAMLTSI